MGAGRCCHFAWWSSWLKKRPSCKNMSENGRNAEEFRGEEFHEETTKELQSETNQPVIKDDYKEGKKESSTGIEGFNGEFVRGKMDAMTEYIDKHIRWYRLIPTIATSGALVFLIYYFHVPIRRIKNVAQLSNSLILRNKTLSGVVKETGNNSIRVWHVPGWRRIVRMGMKPPEQCPPNQLLKIGFSGLHIQYDVAASVWLKQCMLGRTVQVKLLNRNSADDCVDCMVYYKKAGRIKKSTSCVNEELLQLGMGTVMDIQGDVSDRDCAKLTTSLLKAEGSAKRKGLGVWTGTDHVSWWNRFKFFWRRNS